MDIDAQIDEELQHNMNDEFDSLYREIATISSHHGWLAIAQDQVGLYNPDDIDISTYKKMLDDEQVSAGLDVIRLAVLSTDWNINYTGDDEVMRDDIVPWLDNQLRNVNSELGGSKGIRHVLWEMMLAIAYGNIPSEIVLTPPKDIFGRIELSRLKPIDPETIRKFDVDEHSNMKGMVQSVINRSIGGNIIGSTGSGIYIPKKKLLMYSHNMSFQNWWGKSDLRRVYRSWFVKQFVIKFQNIAIEKFALPWTVGTSQDSTDAKKMLKKIKELQRNSAVVLDGDKKIDFLKGIVDRGAFSDAIEYHDRKILTGLLVPPSQLESSVGAYAQSKTQRSTFMLRIKSIQKELEGVMEQLIKLLVDLNHEKVYGEYPTFNFEEPSIDDVIQMSNAVNAAISAGYLDVETDFKWIRERLGFPEAEPHAVIERPSRGPQQMPGPETTRPGLFKGPQQQNIDNLL